MLNHSFPYVLDAGDIPAFHVVQNDNVLLYDSVVYERGFILRCFCRGIFTVQKRQAHKNVIQSEPFASKRKAFSFLLSVKIIA